MFWYTPKRFSTKQFSTKKHFEKITNKIIRKKFMKPLCTSSQYLEDSEGLISAANFTVKAKCSLLASL